MKTDFDCSVAELFEMLKQDKSWESNDAKREEYANNLFLYLMSCE